MSENPSKYLRSQPTAYEDMIISHEWSYDNAEVAFGIKKRSSRTTSLVSQKQNYRKRKNANI
jgi:hypothetical protein